MKLFIDTGILLGMYQSSEPGLEEFRELLRLVDGGKIDLLLSEQVVVGFWRDREGVIADALDGFRKSGSPAIIPNLCRGYAIEMAELERAVAGVHAARKNLETRLEQDIEANTFEADRIVQLLFAAALPEPTNAFVPAARLRADMGNPPGRPGSLGEAINWEWLLNRGMSFDSTEIVILSASADFESELVAGELKECLRIEWMTRYPYCALRLERSVSQLLRRDFPDANAASEARTGRS
jgi:hypothetical protein